MVFLAVNSGDGPAIIEKYWKEEGFKLSAVREDDDGSVSQAFGVQAYPTNYVIGPDGKVLWRSVGYDEGAIRQALAYTEKK